VLATRSYERSHNAECSLSSLTPPRPAVGHGGADMDFRGCANRAQARRAAFDFPVTIHEVAVSAHVVSHRQPLQLLDRLACPLGKGIEGIVHSGQRMVGVRCVPRPCSRCAPSAGRCPRCCGTRERGCRGRCESCSPRQGPRSPVSPTRGSGRTDSSGVCSDRGCR
jgi:hypothetical protein